MGLKCYSFLILVFAALPLMAVDTSDMDVKALVDEYKTKIREWDRRYEDFYTRQREIERQRKERMSHAHEQKLIREKVTKEQEAARQQFVKNRKPKPDQTAAEKEYERQQAEVRKRRDRLRQIFIKQREELEYVRSTAKKIPPKEDVGLE